MVEDVVPCFFLRHGVDCIMCCDYEENYIRLEETRKEKGEKRRTEGEREKEKREIKHRYCLNSIDAFASYRY